MVCLPLATIVALGVGSSYIWSIVSQIPVIAVLGLIALVWVGWLLGMTKEAITIRPRSTRGWGVACRDCGRYGDPEYERRRPSTPPRCFACGSANTEMYESISLVPRGRHRWPWAMALLILAVAVALVWGLVHSATENLH